MKSFVMVIAWFVHLIICYYFIRPLNDIFIRFLLTIIPCVILTWCNCKDLPNYDVYAIMIIAFCWLTTFRLIELIVFSEQNSLTWKKYLIKLFWIYFPLLPLKRKRDEWTLLFYSMMTILKLLINHWIFRWSLLCPPSQNWQKLLLFYISMMTMSHPYDMIIILVRLLTKDQYTLETFTNCPILSISLRQFWNSRYNRLVGTLLKESIYNPIRRQLSLSRTTAMLVTFLLSGLYHFHMAFVICGFVYCAFPSLIFFIFHGFACYLEGYRWMQISPLLGWIRTHVFLLVTAPLILQSWIEKDPPYFLVHPPPYFTAEWMPYLPVPSFCPQSTVIYTKQFITQFYSTFL